MRATGQAEQADPGDADLGLTPDPSPRRADTTEGHSAGHFRLTASKDIFAGQLVRTFILSNYIQVVHFSTAPVVPFSTAIDTQRHC